MFCCIWMVRCGVFEIVCVSSLLTNTQPSAERYLCCKTSKRMSYYRPFLRVLFVKVLNTPESASTGEENSTLLKHKFLKSRSIFIKNVAKGFHRKKGNRTYAMSVVTWRTYVPFKTFSHNMARKANEKRKCHDSELVTPGAQIVSHHARSWEMLTPSTRWPRRRVDPSPCRLKRCQRVESPSFDYFWCGHFFAFAFTLILTVCTFFLSKN